MENTETKDISPAVIRRLPRYYRYLDALLSDGIERISSTELSENMHVTASQIRQDLNQFGGFGQQGYGYNVEYLHDEIAKILGLDKGHTLIVVGTGRLGQALANYSHFSKLGFKIVGLFDVNEKVVGQTVNRLTVRHIDELPAFIESHGVDIAALTLPLSEAEKMARIVADCGIKAIWNFAPVDLYSIEGVTVENVHLSESLMQLSYNLLNMK